MTFMIKRATTERGFSCICFRDRYDQPSIIQKSSLATEAAIWFGVVDADPQVMAADAWKVGINTEKDCGWVPYDLIPPEVLLSTRMHLTQDQVKELLPILTHFAETGELE